MIIFIILYDMNIVEELQVIESVKETNGCPVLEAACYVAFVCFSPLWTQGNKNPQLWFLETYLI